jgi:hypothetical protein
MQQNHNKNGVAVGFQKYFLKIAHKIPQAAQKEHPARKTGCSFCGRMFTS